MVALQENLALAETLTDPVGVTTITGDFASFLAGPFTPDAQVRPTIIASAKGNNAGGATSVTVSLPTLQSYWDEFIAFLEYDGLGAAGDPITGPGGGWSQTEHQKTPDNDAGIQIWRKSGALPFSPDPTTATWTATSRQMSVIVVGVKNGTYGQDGGTASNTASTSSATPSITNAAARIGRLLAGFGGAVAGTWTAPSGMTEVQDEKATSLSDVSVHQMEVSASQVVGVKTAVHSVSSKLHNAYVLHTAVIPKTVGHAGYVKLVLTSPTDIQVDTFDGAMAETMIAILDEDGAFTDWALFNDDADFPPSSPANDLQSAVDTYLEAGTYYVRVWPLSADGWTALEGDADLNIRVPIGKELSTPFIMGTAESELVTPFDMGVVEKELSTPFEMYLPPFSSELSTPFDMLGAIESELSTPFDMEGLISSELSTPFDMLEIFAQPAWGVPTGGTPAIAVVLTADADVGDTTIEVTSTTGFVAGDRILLNVPEVRTILTVLSGTDLELTMPLSYAHLTGSPVTSAYGFQQVMNICDKGGHVIDVLTAFSVTSPPTHAIMTTRATSSAQGNLTFHVPETLNDGSTPNPEVDLLQGDRIVVIGFAGSGTEMWAGAILPTERNRKLTQADCVDLFGQFNNTPAVVFDEPVGDGTPAWAIIAMILEAANSRKALTGELLWAFEHTGSTPFRGARYEYSGDVIGALEDVVSNSGIELLWRAEMDGDQLVATLVCSDRFEVASSLTLADGDGGNVAAGARVIRDPTNLRHSIRLIGASTDLAECLPEYAHWAIRNSTPVVTRQVDPGANRERGVLDVVVPWGYSQATIAALCAETLEAVHQLFYSFLRAIHDMEGRPFHDGYLYPGPSDYLDSAESGSDGVSRRSWRTRLQLVETYPNTPASAVLISDSHVSNNKNLWLIVDYNRRTGVQTVRYWGIPSVAGASMTLFSILDAKIVTVYSASGNRITAKEQWTIDGGTTGGTSGWVESYNTRLYDPFSNRYRNLRRVLSGSRKGKYLDPADPDITLTDLGPGAGIDEDGLSQLIGKVYDFEIYNIDKWDPYRDGVGTLLSRPTIFNGALTSRERWHITPYSSGNEATSSLEYGISATDTAITTSSYAGWPVMESGEFPIKAAIDDGPDREVVTITNLTGLEWTIVRGQDGTTAIVHEPGAPIHRLGGAEPQGLSPIDPEWPEGEEFADELIALLSRESVIIDLDVSNENDDWAQAPLGAIVDVDLDLQRFSGEARVIGRGPDPQGAAGDAGLMKLILEPLP